MSETAPQYDAEPYDHKQTMDELVNVARNVAIIVCAVSKAELNMAALAIEHADSFGAFFDPTAYRDRLHDRGLERQRDLVAFARRIRLDLDKLFPTDSVLQAMLVRSP